jgi:hypothetical protein
VGGGDQVRPLEVFGGGDDELFPYPTGDVMRVQSQDFRAQGPKLAGELFEHPGFVVDGNPYPPHSRGFAQTAVVINGRL